MAIPTEEFKVILKFAFYHSVHGHVPLYAILQESRLDQLEIGQIVSFQWLTGMDFPQWQIVGEEKVRQHTKGHASAKFFHCQMEKCRIRAVVSVTVRAYTK